MSTWGTTTKDRGNRTFLPAGTNNYKLTGVRMENHAYFGNLQAVLDVQLDGVTYNIELPLAGSPTGNDEIVADRIAGAMNALGVKPSVIAGMEAAGQDVSDVENNVAWGSELGLALPTFVGSVLELFVTHRDSKKLKDDGTPFVNANAYINRVVSSPAEPVIAAGVNVPAGVADDDDIPF